MAKLRLPKTLGATSDALYRLKEKIAALKRDIVELDKDRIELKKHAFQLLRDSRTIGAKGKEGQISIKEEDVPTIEDWSAFTKYVARTKNFDLLQHRLSSAAVKERWNDKKDVPGVGMFKKTDLSITKVPVKKK